MHQAGCLPSSLYLSFETKISKVLHHISSLRLSLSSRWWRGIRSCLEFAHCIMFSGCLCNCLTDLREVSGRHLSSSGKRKLIAILQKHEPEPRTVERWSTHFKRAWAFYIISSRLLFLLIEISYFAFSFYSWSFSLIPSWDSYFLSTASHCVHARRLLTLLIHTYTYMHVLNAHTLIHFRLYPCGLSCSSAEHSSTLIKASYLPQCSSFPSHAA